VWYATAVPIGTFRSDFSFVSNPDAGSADGLTFTVRNGLTSAVGADGSELGYTGIAGASEAATFNIYNGGSFGSRFGFTSSGKVVPTTTDMAPLDLHNGHIFHATMQYDGTTLMVA